MQNNRAFTLLELILTLFIVTIMTTMVFSIFKIAVDAWKKSEANIKVYQNARIAIDQISREVKTAFLSTPNSMYLMGYNDGTQTRSTDSTKDELFFIGTLNPGSADHELCEVGFWLDSSSDTLRRFYLTDQASSGFDYLFTTPVALTNDDELCTFITDFQIEYWDDTIGTPAWVTSWDSNAKGVLPKSIKILITAEDEFQRQTKTFQTVVTMR